VPADLKGKEENLGEASLKGHLKNGPDEEASGSQAYVPPEEKDDKQLLAAVDFLHGVKHAETPAATPSPTPVDAAKTEPTQSATPTADPSPSPEPTKSN